MANKFYTDIMEFCVENGVSLSPEQIDSAKQTFDEEGGVEDQAEKTIAASADDPKSDDESQADAAIDAGRADDAEAGDIDPEDILGEIDDEADDDGFQNDEDDIAKADESADISDREFYGMLYDFMNENGIAIPDSAMQTFQESGIFDQADTKSAYTQLLEYCVSNGVAMNADQIAAMQFRFDA